MHITVSVSIGWRVRITITKNFLRGGILMDTITLHVDNSTVWQCGCGSVKEGIDYSDLCLDHDVIMIGPGNGGRYPDCLTSPEFEAACREHGESVESARSFLRQIAEDMTDGVIVVLKRGMSIVRGVGLVVGEYLYHPNFSNISGWNVCHCRRVRWLWRGSKDFNINPLQPSRLSTLGEEKKQKVVRNWLKTLTITDIQLKRPLADLP
jgi:hypothetical protein